MVDRETAAAMYAKSESELLYACNEGAQSLKMEFCRDLLAAECFWMYENNMLDIAPHNDLTKDEWQALAWQVRPILENILLKDKTNKLFQNIYCGEGTQHIRAGEFDYGYNPKLEAALERMVEAANAGKEVSEYKDVFIAESGYEPDWPEESESVKSADTEEYTIDEDDLIKRKAKKKLVNKAINKVYNIFEPKWDEVISRLFSCKELRLGEIMDKDTIDYKTLMALEYFEDSGTYSTYGVYSPVNDRLSRVEWSIRNGAPNIMLANEVRMLFNTPLDLDFDTAMIYLRSDSFSDVVRKIVQHEKPNAFYNNIQLPLMAISSSPKCNPLVALAEAMLGNYYEAMSILDKIDDFMLDNGWANIVERKNTPYDEDNYFYTLSKEDLKGAVNFCKGLIYESQGKPMEAYAMYHTTMGSIAYKYAAERECLCLIKIGMWGQACNLAKKITFCAEMTKSDQSMLLTNYPLLTDPHRRENLDVEFNCPHDHLK